MSGEEQGVVEESDLAGRQLSYPDRRARRRGQTIDEILERAVVVMSADGVAALTMTRLATEMSVQPPSLYKYFRSVLAVYEELFTRGQQQNLDVLRDALDRSPAGLAGLSAGLEALGRWAVEHPVVAQLLFWRPVPGFRPSREATALADDLVRLLQSTLRDAAAAGEMGSSAASDEALAVLAVLHFGVLSQHLANQPDATWEEGTFTRQHATVLAMFVERYR
jgi:AcrR family transcriptional regulator